MNNQQIPSIKALSAAAAIILVVGLHPASANAQAGGAPTDPQIVGIVEAADQSKAQKPVFDSGTIDTGAAWRYVVRKKGAYNYSCTLHPNMKGKLIVQ
jgi:plastocyanin